MKALICSSFDIVARVGIQKSFDFLSVLFKFMLRRSGDLCEPWPERASMPKFAKAYTWIYWYLRSYETKYQWALELAHSSEQPSQ